MYQGCNNFTFIIIWLGKAPTITLSEVGGGGWKETKLSIVSPKKMF